ncbi:TlpA family protein disulfide reductase [Bosea sp. (in: a-proteobacteria)]|jgi:thiol-disulfide isomerase/thioredoxin|uniref:TlpA family protein disulfide reductase n=1 Tax=Bosea sp. (in: a-proteobacteria) TaxID=1871050 RepID=UPI0027326C5F|nr:TlpA disulfide reductase family protein [Bosea sp. (in: a-proteobacteria)]MDP3257462.1 TlpA disulfide reductase family protein [Bosea sp. (in: a-proteobacteria)]MDP3410188.1 TlpA disulfide reductase family protein [Bosea sp. (in: a-proteobacteria)]
MNLGRRRLVFSAAALTLIIAAASGIFVATRRNVPSSPVLSGLAFQTADGRELMGAAFQGRFVLLNVWATWCPPCVKEMPSLDRLQAMKGDSSFEVVALSIDRQGLEVVAPFFKRMGLSNLAIYLDREARSMPALRITGLPTTVLIDPSGREVARWPGAREWDERSTESEIEEHIAKAGKSTR